MCNPELLWYHTTYRISLQKFVPRLWGFWINVSQEYKSLEKIMNFIKIIMAINPVVCDVILPAWHAMSCIIVLLNQYSYAPGITKTLDG